MRLENKTVIITGASGGLGTHVTKAFLEAGARVYGVAPGIKAAEFASERFVAIDAVIAGVADARGMVERAATEAGRVDAVIHLVGGFAGGSAVADADDATVKRMLGMNLWSTFDMIRAVVPHMREHGGGRFIAIGSKAAVEPSPNAGLYAASKAAVVSLIRTVAREEAAHGITANVVLPGTMDTPANRAAMPGADPAKWVQPGQVASLLVHLASDQASQINGAVIPVYGTEV